MCILVIIQDPVTYICDFFRLKIHRQQHQCYLTVTRSGFIIKKQQQQLKSDLGSDNFRLFDKPEPESRGVEQAVDSLRCAVESRLK